MSKPLSKSPHKTTPLTQDQGNQKNASVQEPPLSYPRLPAYTEANRVSQKDMTSPPASQGTQSSVPCAPPTATVSVMPMEFTSKPSEVTCPYCKVPITTRVEHKAGTMTWLLCIFVSICVLCCNFTKDVDHYCPICQRHLGCYHRQCSSRIVIFVVIVITIVIISNILNMLANSRRM